jgi:hypothetical protein
MNNEVEMTHPREYTWFADRATEMENEMTTVTNADYYLHIIRNPHGYSEDDVRDARLYMADAYERAVKELVSCQTAQAALKQEAAKPYAYAGEYDMDNIREMRTVVFRELSGFETEAKQPDAIYPLYRGEKL